MEAAGFDAVIGNPPYDVLASEELGFDISRDLGFFEALPLFEPAIRGKKNLYKLFICRGVSISRASGFISFIVPMALLCDDQSAGVRRLLLSRCTPAQIEVFPQKDDPHNRVFPEAKLSTSIFVAQSGPYDRRFTIRTHPGRYIEDSSATLEIGLSELLKFDTGNLAIPCCTQRDWKIALSILGIPDIKRLGDFCRAFQGKVNETTDGHRGFTSIDPSDGPPILRGSTICLYTIRNASQGEAIYLRKRDYLDGKPDSEKARHYRERRVGWQETSPQNNFRRIIAAHIPAGQFCNHKINYIPESESKLDLDFVLALLNSQISDWFFRLASSNAAVSHYQVYNIPIPPSEEAPPPADSGSSICNHSLPELASVVSELRVRPGLLPVAVRASVAEMSRKIRQTETQRILSNRSDRSRLSVSSQPIQDAIDAILFRCYGLSEDDARYVSMRLKEML